MKTYPREVITTLIIMAIVIGGFVTVGGMEGLVGVILTLALGGLSLILAWYS